MENNNNELILRYKDMYCCQCWPISDEAETSEDEEAAEEDEEAAEENEEAAVEDEAPVVQEGSRKRKLSTEEVIPAKKEPLLEDEVKIPVKESVSHEGEASVEKENVAKEELDIHS